MRQKREPRAATMPFYSKAACLFLLLLYGCSQPSGVPLSEHFRSIQEQAYAKDVEAQYQLGLQYTINSSYARDHERGYQWLLIAAKRGHADAQYQVGMGKRLGRGTKQDQDGAIPFFSRAAEQGHARAQYQLGEAYLHGFGVVQDKPWGRQWLEQAAANGHGTAQLLLGILFAEGVGGQQNQAEAWRWLNQARQSGQKNAQTALERLDAEITVAERVRGEQLLARRYNAAGVQEGPQIRYVQTILNQQGYSAGREDGVAGPGTLSAIARYAADNKLPGDIKPLSLIEHLRDRSR